MSWSYSRGLVEEYLGQCFSDTGLSALLNTTHTPDQFYWPDKTTEHSRISRFGMTCEPLMAIRGEELLTWYLAGFRAKTSALPETVPDWTAKGQGYGQKWLGLLGKYDPDTHSLKTAQLSLLEDSTECCPTLPRWGLMLDGELYPHPMLEPFTEESESGYWPTQQTRFWTNDGDLAQLAKKCDNFDEFNQMAYRAAAKKKSQYWPTATATAYKGWSTNHNRASSDDRLDYTVERESCQLGQQTPPMRLNPDWVEWLMGWPIGQTALKPLATGKFQEFEQQHGSYFMDDKQCA